MTPTLAAVIGTARRSSQMTAVEFDLSLANGDGQAMGAIADACYAHANYDLPPVDESTTNADMQERHERGSALRNLLDVPIQALITAAQAKTYTGWSNASAGPVRYSK